MGKELAVKKVENKKENKLKASKKDKKRVIGIVALVSAIVMVLGGIITGLVFLFKPMEGSIFSPELQDFVDIVNDNNKSSIDLQSEDVKLPSGVLSLQITHLDKKYIIANNDGVDEIFIGYDMVDSYGNILFSLPMNSDHTDEIIYTRLNKNKARKMSA